jgi:hypothetical protein
VTVVFVDLRLEAGRVLDRSESICQRGEGDDASRVAGWFRRWSDHDLGSWLWGSLRNDVGDWVAVLLLVGGASLELLLVPLPFFSFNQVVGAGSAVGLVVLETST